MAEWQNGGMAEWRNGVMVEWGNGGMVIEVQNSGMVIEWQNGGMADLLSLCFSILCSSQRSWIIILVHDVNQMMFCS